LVERMVACHNSSSYSKNERFRPHRI
jgi:hypothetical protein